MLRQEPSKLSSTPLTNTLISIPWGVEITWAMLTPKQVTPRSIVKKIAVASIYSKPNSVKKTLLLDHIAECYHLLNSRYQSGLFCILAGDTGVKVRFYPKPQSQPEASGRFSDQTQSWPDPWSNHHQSFQVLPDSSSSPSPGQWPWQGWVTIWPLNALHEAHW